MKKILSMALVLTFIFFASCGNNQSSQSVTENNTESNTVIDTESNDNSSAPAQSEVVNEVKSRYLEFETENHGLPKKSEDDIDENKDIVLIEDYKSLSDFCDENEFLIKDKYTEEFFEENLVIFIFFIRGSGSISLSAKNVYLDGNGKVTVKICETIPSVQTDDMQYKTIAIKLKKADCGDISEYEYVLESIYEGWYESNEEIEPNDIVTQRKFNGAIYNKSYDVNGKYPFSRLEIAKDKYELEQIIERFENKKDDNLFLEYAQSLDDDFFKENYFVALSFDTPFKDYIFELKRVDTAENCVEFGVLYDARQITEYEDTATVIVAEIPKKDLPENPHFIYKYKYIEQDYTQRLGNIDFTPYIFKGCSGGTHENIALDSLNYLPLNCFINKSRLDDFVGDLCGCYPIEDGFYELIESFDEEFFKDYAVLISYVYVDAGEKVSIENVKRHNHLGFGVLMMEIEIDDSIKPSSNENMDAYTLISVIDKSETIGYDWTNCAFEIK